MWNASTGSALWQRRGHSNYVSSVSWNPSGNTLVSSSFDKSLIVWDAATGDPITALEGHSEWVQSAAWHPAGVLIAAGDGHEHAGAPGLIVVWDARTGRRVAELPGRAGPVKRVAWSPAGDRLAAVSGDGALAIWDPVAGTRLAEASAHGDGALCVAWGPGGLVATGGASGDLAIWDASAAAAGLCVPVARLPSAYGDGVASVAWAPGGGRLASASHDGAVGVWRGRARRAVAVAMALHPRLGAASPLAALEEALVARLAAGVPWDWDSC
jgi:WD40 repeat protein